MSEKAADSVSYDPENPDKLNLTLRLVIPIVRGLSKLFFKEKFEMRENIPQSGPTLIVLNHISVLDPVGTGSFVWSAGRLPLFMIKDGVFKAPVVGKIFHRTRQISVSRGSAAAKKSLADAVAALNAGCTVAVYPEGTVTRDPDFWPMAAKTGVARIALAVPNLTVIPVAQWGAHRSYDYHTKKLRPFPRKTSQIRAMKPFDLTPYRDMPEGEAVKVLTDDLMKAIAGEVGRMRGETPPSELYVYKPAPKASKPEDDAK